MTLRNRHVQTPHTPLGLRLDHITEFERLLYLHPRYDKTSPTEFTIHYDSDDTTLFTVTGKKYSNRPIREFRDASGLPMFEVERSRPGVIWKKPWRVRLPGSEGDLAEIKTKMTRPHDFDISFRNACAVPRQKGHHDEEEDVTVHVQRVSALCAFGAFVGGKKVVDVRESPTRNRTVSGFGPVDGKALPIRGVMEILVADGFDLALVSLLSLDWVACANYLLRPLLLRLLFVIASLGIRRRRGLSWRRGRRG